MPGFSEIVFKNTLCLMRGKGGVIAAMMINPTSCARNIITGNTYTCRRDE